MTMHVQIDGDAPLLLDPAWRVEAAPSVPPALRGTHAAIFHLLRERRLRNAPPLRPRIGGPGRKAPPRPRWDELATQLGAGTMDQLVFHRLLT